MRLVECERVPKVNGTMCVSSTHCKLQVSHDEQGLLDEYVIPLAHWDQDEWDDVLIDIDDTVVKLLETHRYFKVFEDHLDFGDVVYTFQKGDLFKTEIPQLAFICVIPDFTFDQEVTIQKTNVTLDNGISYKLNPCWIDESSDDIDIRINGAYMEPGLCKVRKEEDSMICFEYSHSGYIKRRFVAPIE
jgi:hypothetical protein